MATFGTREEGRISKRACPNSRSTPIDQDMHMCVICLHLYTIIIIHYTLDRPSGGRCERLVREQSRRGPLGRGTARPGNVCGPDALCAGVARQSSADVGVLFDHHGRAEKDAMANPRQS